MSGAEVPPRSWMEVHQTSSSSSSSSVPQPATSKALAEVEEETSVEGRERRKLKNEDSSYDSDFDGACESLASPRTEDAHEDVSRTASETLAAEFEDYVTHQVAGRPPSSSLAVVLAAAGVGTPPRLGATVAAAPSTHHPCLISSPPTLTVTEATPQPSSTAPIFPFSSVPPPPTASASASAVSPAGDGEGPPPHSLAAVVESAEYPQQVEFGVKLGYSESLVQLALTKLGLNPNKNELLDELIRLGAGAPRSDCEEDSTEGEDLEQPAFRQIIIDGSNVAMSHGNKVKFSCKGIRLCVDWFRARGHKEILVFVPMWRKEQSRLDAIITDQDVLQELEKEGVLSFTPSRSCGGKRIVSYDDRYIIKEALKSDGVIVSNDNYRDLLNENAAFRKVIETSILMYSWVNGRFEPPDDPLGRNGPSLDVFLRKPVTGGVSSLTAKDSRLCPYGRKCTYGNKCKYMHPGRGAAPVKSVTEILQEQKQKHYRDKAKSRDSSPGECLRAVKSFSLPVATSEASGTKKPLARTQSTFPAVSLAQTAVTKEGTILEYTGLVSSASSDACSSAAQTSVTTQASVDSLCESLLKGEPLFNLCPTQLTLSANLPWQGREATPVTQSAKLSPLSFNPRVSEHEQISGENLHPKLQRQLSLNPVGDDRLSKLTKQFMGNTPGDYATLMSSLALQQQQQQPLLSSQLLQPLSTPQQQTQQQPQPQQQQTPQQAQPPPPQPPPTQPQSQPSQPHHRLLETEALNNLSCIGTRCISPGPAFSHGYAGRDMMPTYLHPPLTRHSSSQEAKTLQPTFSQHILSPCFHNPVGRNLSAPDQIRGGAGQQQHQNIIPHITRHNSISDSRLNIHGNAADSQQCYDDSSLGRLPYTPLPLASITSSSPGAIGSRPLSPQQQSLSGMVQPSSPRIPQHHPVSGSLAASLQHNLAAGSNTLEDERLKIFYHLSQLFPEAQVRAALSRNPDETDPTKICMSILSMSGCRSVSPQKIGASAGTGTGTGAMSHPALGPSLSLRGTGFGSSFPTSASHDTARESARIEAYSKLSKLFPEDKVRNILLRYPEETEPINLCVLLMATTTSQS